MSKYILMYEGEGPSINEAVTVLSSHDEISVLETLGENIVVEGSAPAVRNILTDLPGWRSAVAKKLGHPDNRVHVKRP